MRSVATVLAVAAIFFSPVNAGARTWLIKADGTGDAPTIQAGINAAVAGDTVLAAAGTYTGAGNRNLSFNGKDLVLLSQSGPEATVIDCQGVTVRGFDFHSGETGAAVVSGFTIRNASMGNGAGMYCLQSSPTIANCVFMGNSAGTRGGGIYCYDGSSPTITGCVFYGNTAPTGGGMFCSYNSSPTIDDCTFAKNSHGVAFIECAPVLSNTIIAFNSPGSAVYTDGVVGVTLTCCDLYGNKGGNYTGSIAGQLGTNGNVSVDPLFCDADAGDFGISSTSPCAPEHSGGCGLIGALGVGCGCSVAPQALDFASVEVGTSRDLGFSIDNVGATILSGTVGESCAYYSLVSGGGEYSLGPGQSLEVTVRFSPTSVGTYGCQIETGDGACFDVTCSGRGVGVPACAISPSELDFGSVIVGQSSDLSFTMENIGTTTLSGTVTESCNHFSIVSGGGTYSLVPGGTRQVTVRFAPAQGGAHGCVIETGDGACSDVDCSGTGLGYSCDVSPAGLGFGNVEVGSSSDRVFTIENTGTATLSGTVGESCDHFSIASGAGAYSLESGEAREVTVRFEPASAGAKVCAVETGDAACSNVDCTGTGVVIKGCEVSPSSLDFGIVEVGSSSDLSFTIENTRTAVLSGTVSESCNHFSIVSGGGSYTLSPGETRQVTVRYEPGSVSEHACVIQTGDAACSDVSCRGEGEGPACYVTPADLDFGAVGVGLGVNRAFTISNTGTTTLSGAVSESSDHYSIIAGDGPYSLEPGETWSVTARFQPASEGTQTCVIETGAEVCSAVNCTGEGSVGEVCEVSPTGLFFGTVQVGSSADRNFTIENTGTAELSGTVSESCNHFSIVSGDGVYSLAPGETRTVTVRYEPVFGGTHTCEVETGHGACSEVDCHGNTGSTAGERGKWGLHFAGSHDPQNNTCDFSMTDCYEMVTSAPATPGRYDIYVMAIDVIAVAGSRIGLDGEGSFFFYGWTNCGDLEIPSGGWPGLGEGVAQTWSQEQPGPHVTLGILDAYVYGFSRLSTAPDPRVGYAEWCDGTQPQPRCYRTTSLGAFGELGFGRLGFNPCGLVPVGLAGFEAAATEEGVLLKWSSTGTSEGDRFFVHRAAIASDGDYLKLHELPLEGTGGGSGDFVFLDAEVIPGTLYYYKLEAVDRLGRSVFFGPYAVKAYEGKADYRLSQNVPNPFRRGSATTIRFSVPEPGEVWVRILDAAGRLVRTFAVSARPGSNSIAWNGTDGSGRRVASGVYFYEIQADGFRAERKMLVVD